MRENEDIAAIRHQAAVLSIWLGGFMLFTLVMLGLTPLLPGQIACTAGGVLGVFALRDSDFRPSRIISFWAAAMTTSGVIGVLLAMNLTD